MVRACESRCWTVRWSELADVEHIDSRGEIDHSDDGSGALSTADAVAGLSMLCGGGGAWGWVR